MWLRRRARLQFSKYSVGSCVRKLIARRVTTNRTPLTRPLLSTCRFQVGSRQTSAHSLKRWTNFVRLTSWTRIISICVRCARKSKTRQKVLLLIRHRAFWSRRSNVLTSTAKRSCAKCGTQPRSTSRSTWTTQWARMQRTRFMICTGWLSTAATPQIAATTTAIARLRVESGLSVMTHALAHLRNEWRWIKKRICYSTKSASKCKTRNPSKIIRKTKA